MSFRPKLPILDPSQLKALRELNTPGDKADIVTDLIDLFITHSPTTLAALATAISEQKRLVIIKLAHKLKGSCANLGAENLRYLCQEMEEKGQSLDWQDLQSRFQALTSTYQLTVEHLLKDWRRSGS